MSEPMFRPRLRDHDLVDEILAIRRDMRTLKRVMNQIFPTGALLLMGATAAPPGFLLCDGTIYNFTAYPDLGNLLTNNYGGNGTTTFAVPDFTNGKFPQGTKSNPGSTGGSNTHTHTLSNNGWAHVAIPGSGRLDTQMKTGVPSWTSTDSVTGMTYSSTGTSRGAGAILDGATDSAGLPAYITFVAFIAI